MAAGQASNDQELIEFLLEVEQTILEIMIISIYIYTLEDTGVLCPSNNTDLFALHYVFVPRINFQLDMFRQSYSHHRLRTARNQSPSNYGQEDWHKNQEMMQFRVSWGFLGKNTFMQIN